LIKLIIYDIIFESILTLEYFYTSP